MHIVKSRRIRFLACLLALVCLLGLLSGCKQEEFDFFSIANQLGLYFNKLTGFDNIYPHSDFVEEFSRYTADLRTAMEKHAALLEQYPNAKGLLQCMVQYPEIIEVYYDNPDEDFSFLDLPEPWAWSVVDLWRDIYSAYCAAVESVDGNFDDMTDEIMLDRIEPKAAIWMDKYYLGSRKKLEWPEPVDWTPPYSDAGSASTE